MRPLSRWWLTMMLAVSATAVAQHKIKIPAEREAGVIILMRVDASGHHVERLSRAELPRKPVARATAKSPAAFRYTVTSEAGIALATGEVTDPRVLRAPLPPPGEKARGHEVVRQATGYYVIRVPQSAAMRYLRIESRAATAPGAAKQTASAQVIDLARFDIR